MEFPIPVPSISHYNPIKIPWISTVWCVFFQPWTKYKIQLMIRWISTWWSHEFPIPCFKKQPKHNFNGCADDLAPSTKPLLGGTQKNAYYVIDLLLKDVYIYIICIHECSKHCYMPNKINLWVIWVNVYIYIHWSGFNHPFPQIALMANMILSPYYSTYVIDGQHMTWTNPILNWCLLCCGIS